MRRDRGRSRPRCGGERGRCEEMRRDRGRSRPRCGGERARRLTTAARREVSAFEPRPARVSSTRAPNQPQTSSKRAQTSSSSKPAPNQLQASSNQLQLQTSSKLAPRQLQPPSFNLVQSRSIWLRCNARGASLETESSRRDTQCLRREEACQHTCGERMAPW
jgi:hypothetical protein